MRTATRGLATRIRVFVCYEPRRIAGKRARPTSKQHSTTDSSSRTASSQQPHHSCIAARDCVNPNTKRTCRQAIFCASAIVRLHDPLIDSSFGAHWVCRFEGEVKEGRCHKIRVCQRTCCIVLLELMCFVRMSDPVHKLWLLALASCVSVVLQQLPEGTRAGPAASGARDRGRRALSIPMTPPSPHGAFRFKKKKGVPIAPS
jgi:hypothetical protein